MEKLPSLSNVDLLPWLDKPELIRKCALQLQKDISPYIPGIEFTSESNNVYEELFNQLEPFIMGLNPGTLQEILYRVDVNEEKASSVMQSGEPYSKTITRLILWRELQKVVTRYLISSGQVKFD